MTWPASLTAWICPGIWIAYCWHFLSNIVIHVCGFTQICLFALYNQCLSYPMFFSPNMANTVNAALKPLETLSRIVNQPSNLFGGKGGSSKNKTEHDTVGTARDSNSNTQDQGTRAERDTSTVEILKCTCWYSKWIISLRGVWWDRTSRGQSPGARNWQWPHGWRGGGRHCGHCWPARGAKHSGDAGNLCCISHYWFVFFCFYFFFCSAQYWSCIILDCSLLWYCNLYFFSSNFLS